MKIVVATDSFKGSLRAGEASEAVRRGILAVLPDAEVGRRPVLGGRGGGRRLPSARPPPPTRTPASAARSLPPAGQPSIGGLSNSAPAPFHRRVLAGSQPSRSSASCTMPATHALPSSLKCQRQLSGLVVSTAKSVTGSAASRSRTCPASSDTSSTDLRAHACVRFRCSASSVSGSTPIG